MVVKRIVQQKDIARLQVDERKLPAELLERMGPEAAGDESAEVFAAEVDFDGAFEMERIGEITHGAEMITDGAATLVDAFDDRFGLACGEQFEAMGTARFSADAIPVARVVAAARTREPGRNVPSHRQPQTFHEGDAVRCGG